MSGPSTIGAAIATILLPRPGNDLTRWAVIACDQFTSEPEYWEQVAALVGDAPSTYHMILPEVYLETPEEARRLQSIHSTMQDYLARGVFVEHRGIVLVERTVAGRTRHGLMLALDLEQYDYSKGSTSLIRATEGTILERIPPRVRIRSGAPLELPHILVLIDDPDRTVIEPLVAARQGLPRLYDFELMLGSGRLTGYLVDRADLERRVMAALARLADPVHFADKYNLANDVPALVFAMGDGNHSLATAKAIWEQIRASAGPDHPARYALVEIENIHDAGLVFEPIHRVLFDVRSDFVKALEDYTGGRSYFVQCATPEAMVDLVQSQAERHGTQAFGVVTSHGFSVAYVPDATSNLAVGTLQVFLDAWGSAGGFGKIDYVHGAETTLRLGALPGNAGLYLPPISKSAFFRTVILDGALPRKTFSMGEAKEKRFYMEARRIM
jgi:hypothetical protein